MKGIPWFADHKMEFSESLLRVINQVEISNSKSWKSIFKLNKHNRLSLFLELMMPCECKKILFLQDSDTLASVTMAKRSPGCRIQVVSEKLSSLLPLQAAVRHERIQNLNISGADFLDLPFADRSFDFVFLDSIPHYGKGKRSKVDMKELLEQIRRVLKPAKKLMIAGRTLTYGSSWKEVAKSSFVPRKALLNTILKVGCKDTLVYYVHPDVDSPKEFHTDSEGMHNNRLTNSLSRRLKGKEEPYFVEAAFES